tara:strand:+ start:342 stop:530 length:189 start_codon:yes stop_codon:yes gene_type:complete
LGKFIRRMVMTDLIYNYRTETYMTEKEAKSCACEDFMPSQNGIREEPTRHYERDGDYLREVS